MKVYISGPITGLEKDDYMENFKRAQELIEAAGCKAINPAAVNERLPEGTTHEEYMEMSITMMDMCDAIYLLKGWEESTGATIEFVNAIKRKMIIIFQKPNIKCQDRMYKKYYIKMYS